MTLRPLFFIAACVASASATSSCRPSPPPATQPGVAVMDTIPLPVIPVYEIASGGSETVLTPARARDPLAGVTSTKLITVTAANQDVRMLLLWLAEQANTSLVISPDVNARVTVSFRDVPVADAMRAVMLEAGLSVLVGPMRAPWPPVVFYQVPVNVDTASAEVIAARFGVSLEMARFIVESRAKSP